MHFKNKCDRFNTDWKKAASKPLGEKELTMYSNWSFKARKELIKMKPEYFEGILDETKHGSPSELMDSVASYKELGLPPVLVHGDLWTSNIMFKKTDDATPKAGDQLLSIIDWQGGHSGNLAEDFTRILILSCSTELRRTHKMDILQHYYSNLSQLMPGNKVPFTFQDVIRAYDRMLPYTMNYFLIAIPFFSTFLQLSESKKDELLLKGRDLVNDVNALTK